MDGSGTFQSATPAPIKLMRFRPRKSFSARMTIPEAPSTTTSSSRARATQVLSWPPRCRSLRRQQRLHGVQDFLSRERLGHDTPCPESRGNGEIILRTASSATRDGNNADQREFVSQLQNRFHPFLLRHDQVRDNEVRGGSPVGAHAFHAVGRLDDLKASALEDLVEQGADLFVVVDDQNLWH